VTAGKFVGFEDDLELVLFAPVPMLEVVFERFELSINSPGPISGVSKKQLRWKWPKQWLRGRLLPPMSNASEECQRESA